MVNAVAYLQGAAYATIGLVWFSQEKGSQSTNVYANITGVAAGDHGLHIHQFGDLSQGCASLGPHFNPFNKTHGGPTDTEKHPGDFGNVVADGDGKVQFHLTVDSLDFSGDNSILGRGIVLHAGKDDLGKGNSPDSKLTGNSGERLACGIIGLAPDAATLD
ncbi:copper/zinc superoxide dismutase [Phascolomyces articulosus]|uniref:Superoxide dismutase [Cu-Zn] n=1 Tax=Phascolomyces articulosus TaxID=60185 RepID=A0AAD5JW65_9FUNG|nr:copper/zinc superoxide dismutase [Phascolomyces articulosus]